MESGPVTAVTRDGNVCPMTSWSGFGQAVRGHQGLAEVPEGGGDPIRVSPGGRMVVLTIRVGGGWTGVGEPVCRAARRVTGVSVVVPARWRPV
jgi:hypothetical protein